MTGQEMDEVRLAVQAAYWDGFSAAMWFKPWKQEKMVENGELKERAEDYAANLIYTRFARRPTEQEDGDE